MEFEPYRALINVNTATNVTQFNQVLATLLDGIKTQAASGDSLLKFETGNATFSNSETIYALAQCTPDLSQLDCNDCLSNATDLLSQCCGGRLGARDFTPSCIIRYEKDIFYDPLVADAPVTPQTVADTPVSPPPVAGAPISPPPPVANAPLLPPVDAPSPPVASAPPPHQPYIETGEGNLDSGFQVLATVAPLMILQYLVF